MKGIVIVAIIIVAIASVVLLLPQLQGHAIRTLPGWTEHLSESEPQTVEYVARPASELGKELLSPWISEHLKESAWNNARGKWVLWKGDVHSVEPVVRPSRIVLVYEHEAPLPFYTQQFGVVVEFDAQWGESLRGRTVGDTVYFRAILVEREFRLADVYRYGLDFGSSVLLLEDAEIIDENDIAAKLIDLAYSSYEQVDRLVAVAERADDITAYFARRANVSSDMRWQLSAAALRIAGMRLPHDPPLDGDDYSGSRGISLTDIGREAALARSEIESSLAGALIFLHDADTTSKYDYEAIEQRMQSTARMVTANEYFVEEVEILRAEDRRRGDVGIGDLGWFGLGEILDKIIGWPASLVISVVEAAVVFGEDLGYRSLYEGMVVICERQLHIVSMGIESICDNTILTIENAIGST